jgi:hypothetical protein
LIKLTNKLKNVTFVKLLNKQTATTQTINKNDRKGSDRMPQKGKPKYKRNDENNGK